MGRGGDRQRVVAFVLAVVLGALFGGGDQYLGSLASLGSWAPQVSLLSAPWLAVPFLAGSTQPVARRAALLGLTASCAALAGYFAMIMGPFEGGRAAFNAVELRGLVFSNGLNIAGALTTGPLYGWLGHAWRVRRAVLSATLLAGAFMLEPLALHLVGRVSSGEPLFVPLGEMTAGLAAAGYFYARRLQLRHLRERLGPS